GYDFEGETRTVDVHIASSRSKIEPYQGVIKTIRSLGYKVGDEK
ncbi:MAG: winged helix-turn-helix domain-containing protein, partial [Fenollaria timonensis]